LVTATASAAKAMLNTALKPRIKLKLPSLAGGTQHVQVDEVQPFVQENLQEGLSELDDKWAQRA
jgi:hypothetical protein